MAAVVFLAQRTAVVVMTGSYSPVDLLGKYAATLQEKWVVLTHFGYLNFIHHWTISLAELSPAIFTNIVENRITV